MKKNTTENNIFHWLICMITDLG